VSIREVVEGNSPSIPAEAAAELSQLVTHHESWRSQCLNLIASENVLSPEVHAALDSDLVHRYADYTGRDLSARHYRGNRFIVEIEREVCGLASEVFRAEHVELRPLSGHTAGIAVLMGLCRPGDAVLEIGRDGGGHRETTKFAGSDLVELDVHYLPIDPSRYNVDAEAARAQIEQLRPRVVILGSSNFLFPHPVGELRRAVDAVPGTLLVYDASHVLGLIAAGRFQDPLTEGADVVFGSTHKTFFGPQGGIIYSHRSDLMDRISAALYPGLVTNHHPFRLPALGVALAEMIACGAAYADQVIANSQALGEALSSAGIPCVSADGRYSRSHTLLLRVAEYGDANTVARRLEDASIVTGEAFLPAELGSEGIRMGTQEMTRRGLTEVEIPRVAQLIADAVRAARSADAIAHEVAELVRSLGPLRFTLSDAARAPR
jgi:glycine hydroxymethyltransferase